MLEIKEKIIIILQNHDALYFNNDLNDCNCLLQLDTYQPIWKDKYYSLQWLFDFTLSFLMGLQPDHYCPLVKGYLFQNSNHHVQRVLCNTKLVMPNILI